MGSRSTYPLGALGGFEGRALKAGDKLALGDASGEAKAGRVVAPDLRRLPGKTVELRALPGLCWRRITEEAGENFFEDTWKVAPEADRIGYRFRGGCPLGFVPRTQPFGAGSDPSNIVDSCYPYGSIQVPGGTEPIVLHRDAVSGGGYFMLGTVVSADMDLIGQLQPHQPARFVKVDIETALKGAGGGEGAPRSAQANLS
jgi:allophanate hydrolase subunit 2